jgi:hypothetical protein
VGRTTNSPPAAFPGIEKPGTIVLMKRAIHVFFWISVVAAIAAIAVRHGQKPPSPPSSAGERPAPELAVEPHSSPTLPDAGRSDVGGAPPARGTAKATATPAPRTETDFMRRIRDSVRSNPELALSLAQEARQEFGDSADSDERDKLLVDALINLQKIGAARDETTYYYRHHPAGQYRQYLWAMTGARPDPPAGPANGR